MKCLTEKSEDKIRQAAKRVFFRKGFDGTTSRDIACEAGMNIALTNYYFRSKEKLFEEIFRDVLEKYFRSSIDILNKQIGVKEKISQLIENDFEMMKGEPDMVVFIMNEIHKEPDRLRNDMDLFNQLRSTVVAAQLKEGVADGSLRDVQIENLLPLIKYSIEFIFLGKSLYKKLYDMDENSFALYAEKQKDHIRSMICNYLINEDVAFAF